MRLLLAAPFALVAALLVACEPPRPTPPSAAPPADHTPFFVRHHEAADGCAACHGPEPCARCHHARPPADHRPGFAGAPHAAAARLEPDRCAVCHAGPLCARCHAH
ncbi:MAG: hypothetical protein KC620_22770 [Myxococcales bacterium]|nr:hypothetical protein [Myxococcales bacterium]